MENSLLYKPALPLDLHQGCGRKEAYACFNIDYTPQKQHLNTGLSPMCPDRGYFIFITLNKEEYEPVFSYEDQLFADKFIWVTRRDRDENHEDYVRLRNPNTRVSLFVRNKPLENFYYLGELEYESHRQFTEEVSNRIQQSYTWKLKFPLSDEFLQELTFGLKWKDDKPTRNRNSGQLKGRRSSTLDELKKAYSYAVVAGDRTINPAHHNFQIHLQQVLKAKGISAEFEKDFIDVLFRLEGEIYIGEIKVTTNLPLSFAFRTAFGQLHEYAYLRFDKPPRMIMFLDRRLDERRLALATKFSISVVIRDADDYLFINPETDSSLSSIFNT